MHTKLTIPERLKDLRVSEKKMSLQELSDATGIPCSTLGNYERDENVDISLQLAGYEFNDLTVLRIEQGIRFVPDYEVVALAEYFQVSCDYLLGITEK